jgi:hypothetical protein
MNPAQLKGMLKEGITEFAVTTTPITSDLPYWVKPSFANIKSCPTGLTKATVIEDGHKWIEEYTFGCGGDQVHETPRRNGVLIRVDLPDGETRDKALKNAKKMPHTNIVARPEQNGRRVIEMIVSRKAIIVPWGEYALVEAEREKVREGERERYSRLHAAAEALGVRTDRESDGWTPYHEYKRRGLKPNKKNWDKYHKETAKSSHYIVKNDRTGLDALYGVIEIPLDRAEQIADVLRDIADPENRHSQRAQKLAASIVGEPS